MDAAYTGAEIARRRKSLGITQKELAEKIHVTVKAVSKWERGINFPDLGMMESLAAALETTPVSLLGLENANQEEIISTLTEVSIEQLEEARTDLSRIGWGALVLAAALLVAYQLFGSKDIVEKQRAYQVLHTVITVIGFAALYILFRYEQIRKIGVRDLYILYTAVLAILIYLGYQFVTGRYPPLWLAVATLAAASSSVQLLFYRIMKPRPVKALPVLSCIAYLFWQGFRINPEFASCLLSCAAVYFLCILKKRECQ